MSDCKQEIVDLIWWIKTAEELRAAQNASSCRLDCFNKAMAEMTNAIVRLDERLRMTPASEPKPAIAEPAPPKRIPDPPDGYDWVPVGEVIPAGYLMREDEAPLEWRAGTCFEGEVCRSAWVATFCRPVRKTLAELAAALCNARDLFVTESLAYFNMAQDGTVLSEERSRRWFAYRDSANGYTSALDAYNVRNAEDTQ